MFVIQIPAWNCERYIARTMRSALMQDYDKHYQIVVVDDGSIDQTSEIVEHIKNTNVNKNAEIVHIVQSNRGQLQTTYEIAYMSEREADVIVHLDHDDQFATSGVLKRLDKEYSGPDIWMTYGSYDLDLESRSKLPGWPAKGISAPVPADRHSRKLYPFVMSHLKTYKRWLFKRIDVKDLQDADGKFYTRATEFAWTFPMIEMCGPEHAHYIDDILYLYNDKNLTSMSRLDGGEGKTHDEVRRKAMIVVDEILAKPEYGRIR